jgi:conjugative relaxase-like TrwC/TraI family protein
MLTVQKLKAVRAARAVEYFSDDEMQRVRGDYYVSPAGVRATQPGRWMGGLARSLQLSDDVTIEQFLNALDGRHPLTGERLAAFRKDRVAAHDVTAAAPKPVSAVWALATPSTRAAVQAAQDAAAEAMLAYAEANVQVIRRGRNGLVVETAAELLAVGFSHNTSRQTAKQAALRLPADPHLHNHVVTTIARRHDGKVVAIASKPLKLARQELEAVYYVSLATQLAGLGFEIKRMTGPGGRSFEIKGVSSALCDEWSSRHREIAENSEAQIAAFQAKYGRIPNAVEQRDLDLRCRMPKGKPFDNPAQFWRLVGNEYGVTAESIEALRRPGVLPSPAVGRAQVRAELLADDGLTKEHAAFDTRTLRIAAFQRAAGVITVPDAERVIADLIASGEVLSVGHDRWTTRAMLGLEQQVVSWREERRVAPLPPPSTQQLAWKAIRVQQEARNVTFATEQLEALHTMLFSRFTAITGAAGAGKTAIVAAAAHVWRAQDRRVFAVAVAGATAQRLASDLGEGATAMTFDGLTTRLRRSSLELRDNDVIVVDEAGMIDTRRWATLVSVVKDRACVVTLGDHAQLSPLSAGGLWPLLAKGGPELREVHRTKLEWERKAWDLLRRGDAADALVAYARNGHLTMSATRADALAAAVAAWNADGRAGLIITDASNAERDAVNLQAQQCKLAAGELGATGVTLAPTRAALHGGDRIIFRRQWRIGGGVRRVENGTTGVVVAVDAARNVVTVRTDEQHPRDLEVIADHDPLLDLAYTTHVYKAQGATVDQTYVVAGGWQTHRESLYVACSRSRHGTRLFLDHQSLERITDPDALAVMAARGERSRAKRAALEADPASVSRRSRPVLSSREPLTEIFARRQRLRWARHLARNARKHNADDGLDWPPPHRHQRTVKQIAYTSRVPAWVIRTVQHVTERSYVE